MIANVDGDEVEVMREDGVIVRTIHCSSDATAAYVDGDHVNVQLENGHSEIYRTDGSIVRRF